MTAALLPRLAITLGDVAGIGPEVVVRALGDRGVQRCCRPVIIGDRQALERAAAAIGVPSPLASGRFGGVEHVQIDAPGLSEVRLGAVDPRAGEAAHRSLIAAIDRALAGAVDGIVTAPISKSALHLAGYDEPGHTEILARCCGVKQFAMMLFLPGREILRGPSDERQDGSAPDRPDSGSPVVHGPHGLAVAHVTLHTSIASVPGLLSVERIADTIRLTDRFLRRIGCIEPRIGVCALNPHAGEDGLFGDEESRLIEPAVARGRAERIGACGPYPADTLLKRAVDGEFDGVVAMYHDQGHIALKLIAFGRAVNVTLGLPFVRTSPSHGTAFDIARKFQADPAGMIAAIRLAARLAASPGRD